MLWWVFSFVRHIETWLIIKINQTRCQYVFERNAKEWHRSVFPQKDCGYLTAVVDIDRTNDVWFLLTGKLMASKNVSSIARDTKLMFSFQINNAMAVGQQKLLVSYSISRKNSYRSQIWVESFSKNIGRIRMKTCLVQFWSVRSMHIPSLFVNRYSSPFMVGGVVTFYRLQTCDKLVCVGEQRQIILSSQNWTSLSLKFLHGCLREDPAETNSNNKDNRSPLAWRQKWPGCKDDRTFLYLLKDSLALKHDRFNYLYSTCPFSLPLLFFDCDASVRTEEINVDSGCGSEEPSRRLLQIVKAMCDRFSWYLLINSFGVSLSSWIRSRIAIVVEKAKEIEIRHSAEGYFGCQRCRQRNTSTVECRLAELICIWSRRVEV